MTHSLLRPVVARAGGTGVAMTARRLMSGILGVSAVLLMSAAAAWACVSGPSVHFSSTAAKPGDQILVTGANFTQKSAVAVHWNGLNGPLLATMHVPDDSGAMGAFTVPADATTGTYVVIFTQSTPAGKLSQAPIRGVITVNASGAAAPVFVSGAAGSRADGLVTSHGAVSTASLILTAVGVAGVAIFLAGLGVLVAGRRSGAAETVKSSQ